MKVLQLTIYIVQHKQLYGFVQNVVENIRTQFAIESVTMIVVLTVLIEKH